MAVGKVEDLAIGKRISIAQPDAAKAYSAQFTAPIAGDIAKNERVLAIIKSRVVGSFGEAAASCRTLHVIWQHDRRGHFSRVDGAAGGIHRR